MFQTTNQYNIYYILYIIYYTLYNILYIFLRKWVDDHPPRTWQSAQTLSKAHVAHMSHNPENDLEESGPPKEQELRE